MRTTVATVALCLVALFTPRDAAPARSAPGAPGPINQGWRFSRDETPRLDPDDPRARPAFDDSSWDTVTLPHTAKVEPPTHGPDYFKGTCWYRRRLAVQPAWRGKQVQLAFDGAMQVADVWVNGRHEATHRGGYLPFAVDLTRDAAANDTLLVAVRLDNRANREVPPGSDRIDFAYDGGLYRGVRLLVKDGVSLTDDVFANRVAGGGVFVRYERVSRASADVVVQAHVQNAGSGPANVTVEERLLDAEGRTAAVDRSKAVLVAPGSGTEVAATLRVARPNLWHPDHPYLHRLVTTVWRDGVVSDRRETHCGIRHLAYTDDGFFINGERLVLRGANRHMSFPWLGNAGSDNMQYRDLRLLKEAGFNFVRLAHYPQSTAAMDACDELGLLVLVCTPGWQFFDPSDAFARAALQNVREMVRWHRNHPSAILWEVSLNETYGHDEFYAACARAASDEYPGGQLFTSGDTNRSTHVRHYDVTYTEWAGFYSRPLHPDARIRKGLHREYGDYEFGGQQSTTRVPRGAGEEKLLLQAWNFQWSHNQNLSWPWTIGDAIWAGIDAASGFDELDAAGRGAGSWWGPLDIDRVPTFSYAFYQSQRDPGIVRRDIDSGPMVFLATHWTARPSPAKVIVYSNADEVELSVNGRVVARQRPDSGPDSEYGPGIAADAERPAVGASFDGGNARHIAHPPFTFVGVPFEAGELKAVAYRAGRPVAADVRRTPGRPARLRLRAPDRGRPLAAGASDALFAYADVLDEVGGVVPDAEATVTFTVSGPARIVGPPSRAAQAGVAAILVQAADTPGIVHLRVAAPGLAPATLTVATR
jgi:beta-galactosidase